MIVLHIRLGISMSHVGERLCALPPARHAAFAQVCFIQTSRTAQKCVQDNNRADALGLSLTSDEENEMATTHTAEMSDKVLAFDNLTVYAYTLRSHFQPWLARSMELSLEALTFPHSEEVREVSPACKVD